MKFRSAVAVTLLAIIPAGAAVACSDDDSATTTSSTTTSAPRNFSVSTPDGQASLALDGELPPGWPQDFPLPSGAEVAGSGSLGGTDSTVRVAVFSTSGSGQDTLDFYVDNDDVETADPSAAGSGDGFLGSVDLVSPDEGSVTVLSKDGTSYLVVTLTTAADGGAGSTTTTTG